MANYINQNGAAEVKVSRSNVSANYWLPRLVKLLHVECNKNTLCIMTGSDFDLDKPSTGGCSTVVL